MGFLDSLLSTVESGELEKHLERLAGTVEKASVRVDSTLQAVAEQPVKLTQTVPQEVVQIEKPSRRVSIPVTEGVEN